MSLFTIEQLEQILELHPIQRPNSYDWAYQINEAADRLQAEGHDTETILESLEEMLSQIQSTSYIGPQPDDYNFRTVVLTTQQVQTVLAWYKFALNKKSL